MFHRARRLMRRDDTLAWDVVQETFLRAHKYRHTYAGGSMLSWLFTIADRVAFDAIRRRGEVVDDEEARRQLARMEAIETGAQLPSQAPRAESALERAMRDDLVAKALGGVDNDTRRILVHRYVDELNTDAIAARTGQSERTIRRRLERFFATAQRKLRSSSAMEV